MTTTKRDLASVYAAMTDDEVVDIAAGRESLTSEACTALDSELAHRQETRSEVARDRSTISYRELPSGFEIIMAPFCARPALAAAICFVSPLFAISAWRSAYLLTNYGREIAGHAEISGSNRLVSHMFFRFLLLFSVAILGFGAACGKAALSSRLNIVPRILVALMALAEAVLAILCLFGVTVGSG